ncbi:MAG TPA: acyltransferase family protein, partial [Novosphingobium sp.]|nr:acyltransferase family protein [Novosphingobium sp.]
MTAKGSNRLDAFDTLRGLAALAVLGHHLRLGFDPAGTMIWFGQGFLAVDLFFLLSGYVMARTYEPAFAGGAGA